MQNLVGSLAAQPPSNTSLPIASNPKASDRIQLDFIDGMRALAALYIVVHHVLQTAGYTRWWLYPFSFGYEVVVVFITISGFCLALPQARRGIWTLDASAFYWKRARRILPPYYAAVAIGLLFFLFPGRQDC